MHPRWAVIHLATIAALLLAMAAEHGAIAQERGPGGPGAGFRGGPGGGFPGGGAGGLADFLRRLDRNGNNMLDPDEAQGPASFFLQRLARENRSIDPSRPIPIDRLVREMEQMRQRRMQESGSNEGRDDRSSSGDRGSASASSTTAPLAPGFGEESTLPLAIGFGVAGEVLTTQVSDRDRSMAEDRIRRYDANKDGYLSGDELRSSGRGGDDLLQYDKNRDGKLTAVELAARYAGRRASEQGRGGAAASPGARSNINTNTSSSNRQPPSTPSGSTAAAPGQPPFNGDRSRGGGPPNGAGGPNQPDREAMMKQMVDGMFERYDTNKNGVFDREEWGGFRSDPSSADANRDGRIDRNEITTWMTSRMGGFAGRGRGRGGNEQRGEQRGGDPRSGGNPQGGWYAGQRPGEGGDPRRQAGPGSKGGAPAQLTGGRVDPRKSYRFSNAADRLAKLELPDWFARDDANQDGQIMMVEFSAAWSDSVAAEFSQFDLNGDGMITPQECLAAKENGAVRGAAGGGVPVNVSANSPSSAGSVNTAKPAETATVAAVAKTDGAAKPAAAPAPAAAASSNAEVPEQYLKYAVGRIKQFDANGDGMLSGEERSKDARIPPTADADGDGKITPRELALAYMKK